MRLLFESILIIALADMVVVAFTIGAIATGQDVQHTAFFDPQIELINRFIN